ncbi:GntR family transcriptional regulator [Rhodococcus sp. T2V]|uniref:GntR family transcriptional regulator n=1 Tax=Rhodococcus sp. T2V TaxID=3034164 RepID=UPI0023E0DABF|nr:GntR family transcriptional regulator [Rhodococcus sp. T2V]MDF3311462.1 GntR family transcriptional regulator [Rhodococcus sp. T2V]
MTDGATLPPTSRTEYVAARIREDVASGLLRPGEFIKQTVLAKRYGVSPTPVREALRLLEADGVITYASHRGASVVEMTPETARDLYHLRAATEGLAASTAVERMTPEGLASITTAYRELEDAIESGGKSSVELSVLNKRFHFALYQQSSPLIVQYVETLWVRFVPRTTVWTLHNAPELQKDHARLLDAVVRGDAEAAAQVTREHIFHGMAIREHDPALRPGGRDDREQLPPIERYASDQHA